MTNSPSPSFDQPPPPRLCYTTATFRARPIYFDGYDTVARPPPTPPIHLSSCDGQTRCLGWHWRSCPRNHSASPRLTSSSPRPLFSSSHSGLKTKVSSFPGRHEELSHSGGFTVTVFPRRPGRVLTTLWRGYKGSELPAHWQAGEQNTPPTSSTSCSTPPPPHCSVLTCEGSKLDFSFSAARLIYRWTVSCPAQP